MKRSQLPPAKSSTYVLPRWRTVYVSVPKAACTSLKWLMADLQGESAEHFHRAVSRETTRLATVHHRARWQHTPMLHDLSDAELDEIRPDHGWFVFAVVRHPSARLWSGWQSKFLLAEPRFRDKFPDAPWPRVPAKTDDVLEDFARFVAHLRDEPEAPVLRDRHFRTQAGILRADTVPYTRVYQTSEIQLLLADLEEHLSPLGLDALPRLRRSNETPLQPVRALFTDETSEVIRERYAEDFERFGYDEVVPSGLEPADGYSSESLAEVGRLVERAERIGDLYRSAKAFREAERQQSARVTRLQRRLAASTAKRRPAPTTRAEPVPMLRRMWRHRVNQGLERLTGYELRRVRHHVPGHGGTGSETDGTTGPPTVAEGWDAYARRRREQPEVGDVWSSPKQIGLAVERPEDVVPYLDKTVFTPFLGSVDVLLEIGPGGGRFTEVLLPKCGRLIAVDTSPAMLERLAERFPDHPGLECRLSDGRGLRGVPDGSVGAAFSYGVFVHLQHWDIYHYLSELERVLTPGGRALVQHSNTFSDLGWAKFVRDVPRQLNRHKLHVTFILNSPEIMAELARRAGLEVVDQLTEVVRRDCITLLRKPGARD